MKRPCGWDESAIAIGVSFLHTHICPHLHEGCGDPRPLHEWKHALPRCPHPEHYLCPEGYIDQERRRPRSTVERYRR